MQRKLIALGLLAGVPGAACLGTYLKASQPVSTAHQAIPATAIAFVNFETVYRNHANRFSRNLDLLKALGPFLDRREQLKNQIAKSQVEQENPKLDSKARGRLEEAIRAGKAEFERVDREARDCVRRFNEQQVCTLCKDIYEAIEMHAKIHGLQAVFVYMSPAKYRSNPNVVCLPRGVTPLYVSPHLDITASVTEALNRNYRNGR